MCFFNVKKQELENKGSSVELCFNDFGALQGFNLQRKLHHKK